MKRRQGKGVSLRLDNWRDNGIMMVLLGIISDVHLDPFFPQYSLEGLLYKLDRFLAKVKLHGTAGRGILVILGDFIDFLTLGEISPNDVPAINQVMAKIRELRAAGIKIIMIKGNHDRLLFVNRAWQTWLIHQVPGVSMGDYLYIADDWAQVMMFHGHLWDIFNCEIVDNKDVFVAPLGDLIVKRLVTEMQQVREIAGQPVDCSDINRVYPLHNIPLYLATIDPSRELLKLWLQKFERLMHSKSYRRWRKHALPLGKRILGNLLPLFYDVYLSISSDDYILKLVAQVDKKSSGYMFERQQEILTENLEVENRYYEWDTRMPAVQIVVNGHSHRSGMEEIIVRGQPRRMINTGAWVKRVIVHAENDEARPLIRPQYRLTWTQLDCDLVSRQIYPYQDSHQAI